MSRNLVSSQICDSPLHKFMALQSQNIFISSRKFMTNHGNSVFFPSEYYSFFFTCNGTNTHFNFITRYIVISTGTHFNITHFKLILTPDKYDRVRIKPIFNKLGLLTDRRLLNMKSK